MRYPYSDWHFQNSGLAVIKIAIYPEVYELLDNFDNLVELTVRMQTPSPKVQADIQYNPFRLTQPQGDSKRRSLYILANSANTDTTCWGLIADLRSHVCDVAGNDMAKYVCLPDVYMNQTHGHIVRRGFSLEAYHPWAAKHCPGYRPPKPKKVVDSIVV
jgi:hypothetical protein